MSQAPKVLKAKPICGRRRTTVNAPDEPSTSTLITNRRHSVVNPQVDKKQVRFFEETPQNQKRKKICNETPKVKPPESNTEDEMSIIRCAAERTEEIMTEYSETLSSKVQSTLSDCCVVIQNSIQNYKDLYLKKIEQIYLECESKINELKEAASTSNAETGSQDQPTNDSGDESLSDSNARENGEVRNTEAIPINQYLVDLPPDYRPNDPTWTLKHKKAVDNLVVDIDGNSGVYIEKVGFKSQLHKSTSYNLLVRGLLQEIFTMSALQVCALDESKKRPGLEQRALKALFDFVKKYGERKGWGNYDEKKVRVSLQGKLQTFRKKSDTSTVD